MSKKIIEEEFLERFSRNHPSAEIELLNYTAISKPLTIRCKRCGKTLSKPRARDFIKIFTCCEPERVSAVERLEEFYSKSDEFDFVKHLDRNYCIIYHKKCGQNSKRAISALLDNPYSCPHCNTIKTSNMLSVEEVQDRIDEAFGEGNIKILDYNGQLEKNHYRCQKCGLIFLQKQTCLMQSRGCPRCDRYISKGESTMKKILEQSGLAFQAQVAVPDLPLQHFDFAVYNGNGEISYFIEIQGEGHYKEISVFRDSLEKIQERDERKRKYCKEKNIPLYEIICQKGGLKNLDILPFGSTTISAKESIL